VTWTLSQLGANDVWARSRLHMYTDNLRSTAMPPHIAKSGDSGRTANLQDSSECMGEGEREGPVVIVSAPTLTERLP